MSRLTGDLAAFSRVLSSALLLCGFIILGVAGGRALVTRGYPGWTQPAAIVGGTALGAWQAGSFLKAGMKREREPKPKRQGDRRREAGDRKGKARES